MERREALQLTATLFGTSIFGAQVFLSGCSSPRKSKSALTEEDIPLLTALGEIILPTTSDSPGAGEAEVGKFVYAIIKDCYDEEEARIFENGIRKLEATAQHTFGTDYLMLSNEEQTQLLITLDKEAMEFEKNRKPHFFSMLLQLTIWGYFTSEPGATIALRYNPIPGRYEGCVDYLQGQPAWAS